MVADILAAAGFNPKEIAGICCYKWD